MSYYCIENGVVVKKPGNDPKAMHLKSYYLPGDDNVYHVDDTPEERSYWGEQHALERIYRKKEYFDGLVGEEKAILEKAGFCDKEAFKVYYRKWYESDNIHWCTATCYLSYGNVLKFLGSSGQEFKMSSYGSYWAFDKNDFKPIKRKWVYYG